MATFILTTLPADLLADESDQADAMLGQLALRLPGSIQDNAHLVGHGVAIELAEDIDASTVGFLLRAAYDERQAAAVV
jgi:hypothetical protein